MRSRDSFIEQQGYFTFAQNSRDINYLELAYYQALSIKQTQKVNKFAIAVDSNTKTLITDTHRCVFDYIIDIVDPDPWAMNNEWQVWHLTPFKETIKLESDLLLTNNIDHWWTGMRHQEVCFTTKIRDYEGNVSDAREYRKFFDENYLPNIYTGMYYFRFGNDSLQLFRLAEQIYKNWHIFRDTILKNCREELPSTDVVFAVAAHIFGIEKCTIPSLDYPSFVHMKGSINRLSIDENWTEMYPVDIDGSDIYINFTKQSWPLHYFQKEFINERNRKKLNRSISKLQSSNN